MATAMVAPMRALLSELQAAIDEAAGASAVAPAHGDANDDGAGRGLRGGAHLALCDLTRCIHDELGVLEQAVPVLPENDDDGDGDGGGADGADGAVLAARLAMHKAMSTTRIAQLEERVAAFEARCTQLRHHKRTYFHYYTFNHQKVKLLKARCGGLSREENRALDAEASAAYEHLGEYYDEDQAKRATIRHERERKQQEDDARALDALRTRWGLAPANRAGRV